MWVVHIMNIILVLEEGKFEDLMNSISSTAWVPTDLTEHCKSNKKSPHET